VVAVSLKKTWNIGNSGSSEQQSDQPFDERS